MSDPRKFERELRGDYRMKVDLKKADHNRERTPHWHLYKGGQRLARVTIYLEWDGDSNIDRSLKREAEELTRTWSSEIAKTCEHNRLYGADD